MPIVLDKGRIDAQQVEVPRAADSQWEQVRHDVYRVLCSGLIASAIGCTGAIWFGALIGGAAWAGALVWALASLAGGFGMGFLFGIPRAGRQSPDADNGAGPKDNARGGTRIQQPNTNLEQVSDWVTKILVGLGLVELRNMPDRVWSLAQTAAETMCGPHCSGQAASFALAVIVYSAVVGFIFGYALTRTYLPGAFHRAELSLAERVERVERQVTAAAGLSVKVEQTEKKVEQTEKEAEAAIEIIRKIALGQIRAPQPDVAPESAIPPAAAAVASAEHGAPASDQAGQPAPFSTDDPNKGRFGGLAERDGYALSASVTESDKLPDFYDVVLEVRSTRGESPMPDRVTFHLHPTFGAPVQEVRVHRGVARLELLAWGAFTVGAIVGQTPLELDLSELAEAPKRFREQ